MDSDVLIQTIVERVLSKLKEECVGKAITKVMVLDSYSQKVEEHILNCIHTPDVEVCFWDDSEQCKEAERYIIPLLSCGDMADIALGKAKSPMIEIVLQLLLKGKVVEVIDYEYKVYEKTASPALYKLYQQHESTLNSFGLIHLKSDPELVLRSWQKLISEKDVEQAVQEGVKEMHVIKDSLITPLAKEYAKLNRISVHKKL